jgi:PilZ domain
MSECNSLGVAPTRSQAGYELARRWCRYEVSFPIRVVAVKGTKSTVTGGKAACISEGGMCMSAGTELEPGDHVAVELNPPYSPQSVRVEARVCNRTGYNYGLEFVAQSNSQKQQLARFRHHLSRLVSQCC